MFHVHFLEIPWIIKIYGEFGNFGKFLKTAQTVFNRVWIIVTYSLHIPTADGNLLLKLGKSDTLDNVFIMLRVIPSIPSWTFSDD